MSGRRILVVDDDPLVHEVLESYLELSGYQVVHADNGEQGLEKMLDLPPDLLIVDLQMPVLDGFGLLQRMKLNPLLAGIPAIMLSSLDRPNIKVKGLQLGADDYVVKPFDQAELMARVAVALRQSDARRRLEHTFSGILGPVSLIELLQTMAHGDKSGRVEMLDMGAEILVAGKLMASCRWKSFEGKEAFRRILLAEKGRFRIHFETLSPEETVGSIEDLLLSTLVSIDELREGFGDILSEDLRLNPGEPHPELGLAEGAALSWPVEARELLLLMEGRLEENAQLLRDLMSNQLLTVVKHEGNT